MNREQWTRLLVRCRGWLQSATPVLLEAALWLLFVATFIGLVLKFRAADVVQITAVIAVAAWPAVAAVGLLALRHPLSAFLAGLSQRVSKLSAFNVEIELQTVTATQMVSPVLDELKRGAPLQVADSARQIFAQLQETSRADYVLIDLGDGEEWLTSRLFLVAALFEQMRGVRCVVFTKGTGNAEGKFVGTVAPSTLRWKLAQQYPWLEIALAKALTKATSDDPAAWPVSHKVVRSDDGAFEPYTAEMVARAFISSVQKSSSGDPQEGWLKIHEQPNELWERAEWATAPSVRRLLGAALNRACIPSAERLTNEELVSACVARTGSFVALLHDDRFDDLIDRRAILEELGHRAGTQVKIST
jgi:hypothetical protein